jgi:hypothetical protein
MTSADKIENAARDNGWDVERFDPSTPLIRMRKAGVIIDVYLTKAASVRSAWFEFDGNVYQIKGGAAEVIRQLGR